MYTSVGIVVALEAFFFSIGWVYLTDKLFQDFSDAASRTKVSTRVLFSGTLASSLTIFALLVFEVANVLDQGLRRTLWRWHLALSVLLILIALPVFQIYNFYATNLRWKGFVLVSILTWTVYILILRRVSQSFVPRTSWSDDFTLENNIMRVSVIGVALIASLSGFGAVSAPVQNLEVLKRPVTERDVQVIENKIQQTLGMVFRKKKVLLESQSAQGGKTPWLFSILSSGDSAETSLIKGEIAALEAFLEDLYSDLNLACVDLDQIQLARTFTGKVLNFTGYIFSIVCIFKVISSILGLLFQTVGKVAPDPVTRGLTLLAHFFGLTIDIHFWVTPLSFLFIGVLITGSIRGLLLQAIKVFRRVSHLINPDGIVLFLAHVMGFYFISMVMMLRTSLPKEHRAMVTEILSHREFTNYQRWHDVLFVLSSLASVAFFGMDIRLRRRQEEDKKRWSD